MSERTISPGMEPTHSMPALTRMDDETASPAAGLSGPVKRKWSPDNSASSTGTVISRQETFLETETASAPGEGSPRGSKRARVDGAIPVRKLSADNETRIPADKSRLPPEMWQRIFSYLPPYSLGRLMCVNTIFRSLIAPSGEPPTAQLDGRGLLRLIEQDQLWSLSRRAFFPTMPRPLSSLSEFETWKLVRGSKCEFCGKANTSTIPPVSTSPWAAGPGNDYVRVIWPFAVRSCGNCLRIRLQKETDLLFSSFSALLPALPFAFFTPSLNYVASITLRSEPPPTGLQLIKWYFGPQVESMKAQLQDVKELGAAAAEEWFKGLEKDGKEKAANASRWEQWELSGGFQTITDSISQLRRSQITDRNFDDIHPLTPEKQSNPGMETAKLYGTTNIRPPVHLQTHPWTNQASSLTLPPKPATPVLPHGFTYSGATANPSVAPPKSHPRVERTIHDVNAQKNARRAEIERRCAELNPPIRPSTLVLMDSFAAALQIAMPLTDQAWEQLKPRLLAQREAAEQQEREQMAHNQFLIQQAEERKQQEAQLREAKENIDREWEESQKSVREKLESYADTFVREQWQNGDAVTKASCAQFAADMLLHVRHRFYNALAQEDARMRAMGIPIPTDSPHAAPTRRLTLENMRWVYERKIKPLTEHFQKELFLCNACDNHSKYYTLDSVVQHYAAKHTDSLSMGTAVVYWKADWPELPPFDPNPTAAKASMLASATPSLPPPNQVMFNGPSAYQGHAAGPHVPSGQPMYPSPYNPQHTVQEPSQIYGSISAAYQEPPSPRHNFPHVEQPAFKAFNHPLTASNTPMHGYAIPQPLNRHEWQRQKGTSNILTAYSENGPTFRPAQHSDFEARPGSAMSILSQNQPYQNIPPSSYFPRPQPPSTTRPIFKPIAPGQPMGIYQVQIQELAHNAREIWDATSGITDMPDSVRVQVIIRHVVLRFKDKYTNEPNLALFTDGLNNNFQMSPMRALSGLSCRACATARRMSGIHTSDDNTVPERRLHTLPALVAHFQSAHVEHVQPIAISSTGIEMPRLDWKFDMVEMPDPSVVQNLIYSPGITQAKLNLIATVLPSYFPSPLPQVDLTPHIGVMHAVNLEPESTNRMQDHDVYMRDTNRAVNHFQHLPVAREGVSSDSPDQRYTDASDQENFLLTEAVAEDEYDPHRPAYVNAGRFGRPSLVLSHVQGRQSRYEDEEISGTGASDDQRTGRNAEAVYDNRRMSLIPERAIRSDDKPSARRLEIVAQEHPLRNGSIRENEARRAYHDSRPLPVERRTSPAREPLNAAEQFLQSFDLATDALQAPKESTPAVETLKLDDYCAETGGEPSSRPRPLHYSRLSERANAGTMEFSTKSSPSDPVSTLGRYETVDDGLIDQTYRREHDELHDGRIAESEVRIQRSLAASPDNQSSRARAGHLPSHLKSVRDSPARRPNSRFERYEAQRQGSQGAQSRSSARAAEPLPVGIGSDRDLYPPQRTAPRQVYATQPVERYRGYPYTDEVMYRRAQPQIQQIRYVEKPRYPNPSYDGQVEYVQVASRDSPPEGSYYIRRPVADDGTIEYDGYEPSRPQEQVFERNGHLYTRAPPSSQSYRDPYPRQVTYQ